MKSRSEIWLCALEELGAQCSVSTQRDAVTLARRVEQEGDTFLKVALPKFAKDFELSLAHRRIPPLLFKGFQRRPFTVELSSDGNPMWAVKKSGGVPKFLGGFLDLVFSSELQMDVKEYDILVGSPGEHVAICPPLIEGTDFERQADAVAAIRQLCLMFGKEKELCSSSIVEAAYGTFIETDKELDRPLWTSGPTPSFEEVCSLMFGGQSALSSDLPSTR